MPRLDVSIVASLAAWVVLPQTGRIAEEGIAMGAPEESRHSSTERSSRRSLPAIADSALVDTIGPSWSSTKLRAELGGVSQQVLDQRVTRGDLLGLPTRDGATVYPVFQFRRRDGKVEILPGLPPILTALSDQNAWAVAVVLNTAAPELEGATPMEWTRRGGDADRLAELAGELQRERSGV